MHFFALGTPNLVALLLLIATSAAANPVGVWFSTGQPHDPEMITRDQFNADGTFRFEHRKYRDCELVYRAVEEGHWAQDGNILTTDIESINGAPVSYSHRYRYEAKDENEMHLYHFELDYLYVERRDENFQSRDCWAGA